MSSSFSFVCRILLSPNGRSAAASSLRHARHYGTSRTTCPFQTLGLTKSSDLTYAEVKSRFQKLALKHHPDQLATRTADKEESGGKMEQQRQLTREQATSRFVRYRMAFEAIVESDDGSGLAVLKEDAEYYKVVAEENAAANAQNAKPGHLHMEPNYEDISRLRIDPQVLHEMAELAEDMAPGGLDKGGMWQFAAAMREKAQRGDLPPLQVPEGENNSRGKPTRRRRRRR